MNNYLDDLPNVARRVGALKETIIANIVLIGETPAPTFKEVQRVNAFVDRISQFAVDECSTDNYNNPIAIIRGSSQDKPPIFAVAHLDTFSESDEYVSYRVGKNAIKGPDVADNSAGAGVLISLPAVFKELGICFKSDIVLVGVIHSIGRGDLGGTRHLLKTWSGPIRGAVCIEGVELGRLNHSSVGMVRAEISCRTQTSRTSKRKDVVNAIIVVNEVINRILELRLPQRPRSEVVIGKISGGYNHGRAAEEASVGLEIQSDSDDIVKEMAAEIEEIVDSVKRIYDVKMAFNVIGKINSAWLKFSHPLVKSANRVMRRLNLEPVSMSTESDLSIFLSRKIPAVTLCISRSITGKNGAGIEIDPIFKRIAQIVGVLKAIDEGVCDEEELAPD